MNISLALFFVLNVDKNTTHFTEHSPTFLLTVQSDSFQTLGKSKAKMRGTHSAPTAAGDKAGNLFTVLAGPSPLLECSDISALRASVSDCRDAGHAGKFGAYSRNAGCHASPTSAER